MSEDSAPRLSDSGGSSSFFKSGIRTIGATMRNASTREKESESGKVEEDDGDRAELSAHCGNLIVLCKICLEDFGVTFDESRMVETGYVNEVYDAMPQSLQNKMMKYRMLLFSMPELVSLKNDVWAK